MMYAIGGVDAVSYLANHDRPKCTRVAKRTILFAMGYLVLDQLLEYVDKDDQHLYLRNGSP